MGEVRSHTSSAALRAITYRLTSTPIKQLPHIVPQIAASLWACRDLLSCSAESLKKTSDASIVVHRFKTQLSTLLQDRTVEGRWAAVVLVKAAIEAGGVETLSKSNAWVRNLLGILKKPDPSSTRILAIIALTRIFMLTWDYSNLVREITTPALPAFVSTCLSNVENSRCSPDELQTVLDASATLLPRHPTIFRTNETQLRTLVTRILSQTSSVTDGLHYTHDHQLSAQHIFVLLHHTAPKQGAAEKWDQSLKSSLGSAHATCDHLFRSMIEDWQSTTGVRPSAPPSTLLQGELEAESDYLLGLSSWHGASAGSERLIATLGLIQAHVLTSTAGSVNLHLGSLADLLVRLFSLRQPHSKHETVQANVQVSRDEREAIFLILPNVHVAAMEIVESLLDRFGNAAASVLQPLLSQMTWVFETESTDVTVRTATYSVVGRTLELQGPGFAKEDVADIEGILKAACHDLLPLEARGSTISGNASAQDPANGDLTLQASRGATSHATEFPNLIKAARSLLPIALSKLNARFLPKRLRQLIDFTAAITQDKAALVASVLNPSTVRGHTSLLPLLARFHPDRPEVESLLRPRMPPIGQQVRSSEDDINEDANGYDEDGDPPTVDDEDLVPETQYETPFSRPLDARNGAEDVDDDDGPTAGLLSALDRQDQAHKRPDSHDELYSVSPQRQADPSTNTSIEKRVAVEEVDGDRNPKRSRASPHAETPSPDAAASLPGVDAVVATSASLPTTVVVEQPQSSFVTAPEMSQQSLTMPAGDAGGQMGANAAAVAVDVGSDDSDFEMPPLTMESDTDSHDDEGDDDEEEGE